MTDIYAGDNTRLEFTVTAADGTALDLTNMEVVWGLGDSPTASQLLTKASTNTGEIDIVDATNGRFDVILVPSDTADLGGASYYHEVELTDTNGEEFTVFDGSLYIKLTLV